MLYHQLTVSDIARGRLDKQFYARPAGDQVPPPCPHDWHRPAMLRFDCCRRCGCVRRDAVAMGLRESAR